MRKLVVRGFYGNGNCGDEAILQSIFRYFGKKFGIVLSVNNADHVITRIQRESIYPYNKCQICWNFDRDIIISDETIGIFLGGGGLGLGFGWEQYMFSWLFGKKLIHSGVHITAEYIKNTDEKFNFVTQNFLKSADFLSVRHHASQAACSRLGVQANFLPDWAFGLPEEVTELPHENYVVLVLRDDNYVDIELLKKFLTAIYLYAARIGSEVLLMPFDQADKKLMIKLAVRGVFSEEYYFDPGKALYVTRHAKTVFSIGRYHPIVFSLSSDVPVFSIDVIRLQSSDDKTCLQLIEEGLEDFHFLGERINEFVPDKIVELVEKFNNGYYKKEFLGYRAILDEAAKNIIKILEE